ANGAKEFAVLPTDGELGITFARWAEPEGIKVYWKPRSQPVPRSAIQLTATDALSAMEEVLSKFASSGLRLKMCEFENAVVITNRSDSCSESRN
ncbi:MAG: TcpQ domain-containing protein, partial [Flammeovirgaceae bacterium]